MIHATAGRIVRLERKLQGQSINVILCSDYKIRKLNRCYRGRDRTTDVLSFPFHDQDFLGEIYISLQRAEVQARRYAHAYSREVNMLFVHGLLHLLGYDHKTTNQQRHMETQVARFC